MKRSTLKGIAISKKIAGAAVPAIAKGAYYGIRGAYKGVKGLVKGVYSGVKYAGTKTAQYGRYVGGKVKASSEHKREREEFLAAAHEAEINRDYFTAGQLYAKGGDIHRATRILDISGYVSLAKEDYAKAAASFQIASQIHSPRSREYRRYASLASDMYNLAESEAVSGNNLQARKGRESNLAEMARAAAIILLFGGSLLFLFPNITGGVIAETVPLNNFISGAALFIIGIFSAYFFWVKKQKISR